jgi:hypothetical protein
MTRTLQRYQQDIGLGGGGFLKKYIPVLTKAFQKKNEQTDDAENTDQLASFFFRWLLPKSRFEVYGEWGYNDYKQNIRDYVMDATHSAAYTIGVQKLYAAQKYDLLLGAELTKTSESASNLLRRAGNWYVHGGDNGYTHANQIVGAGFGYGSNMISFRMNYFPKSQNFSLLFQLEKVTRDPNSFSAKWTDYIWQITPRWRTNRLQITLPLHFVYSNTYLWNSESKAKNMLMRINFNYSL